MVARAYHARLCDLLALNSAALLKDKEESKCLASLYAALEAELKWLEEIHSLFEDQKQIFRAKENVLSCIQEITALYLELVKKAYLGNPHALKNPEMIIVLGTSSPQVEERLELATLWAQKFPQTPLILSGGGKNLESEADFMGGFLLQKGITNPLYKETDSLDTKGNALFSKLLMKKENLLEKKQILLITSNYHAPRSLYFFEALFGPSYQIAAALAPAENPTHISVNHVIQNEMHYFAYFAKEILTLRKMSNNGEEIEEDLTGDHESLFYQMLLYNPMYQKRWDLARRYHY